MAVRSGVGLPVAGVADHHELFTEAPSRVVVCTTARTSSWPGRPTPAGSGRVLGTAGGDRFVVDDLVDVDLARPPPRGADRLPGLLDELAPAAAAGLRLGGHGRRPDGRAAELVEDPVGHLEVARARPD